MEMSMAYYTDKYTAAYERCYIEANRIGARDLPEAALTIFNEGPTAEEIVGYYLFYAEDRDLAQRQWLENLARVDADKHTATDKEVTAVFRKLCGIRGKEKEDETQG